MLFLNYISYYTKLTQPPIADVLIGAIAPVSLLYFLFRKKKVNKNTRTMLKEHLPDYNKW